MVRLGWPIWNRLEAGLSWSFLGTRRTTGTAYFAGITSLEALIDLWRVDHHPVAAALFRKVEGRIRLSLHVLC